MEALSKFPYEGNWRTLEEIKNARKSAKKRDRSIFCNLIVLYILVSLFLVVIWQFGFRFFLPK